MLDVNVEKILPVTDVRDSLNKIIDEVESSDELYVVTKNGKPSAIIVGVHHLEKLTGISKKDLMPEESPAAAAPFQPAASTTPVATVSTATSQPAATTTTNNQTTTAAPTSTPPVASSPSVTPVTATTPAPSTAPSIPSTGVTTPPPAVPNLTNLPVSDDIFATDSSNDDLFGTPAPTVNPNPTPNTASSTPMAETLSQAIPPTQSNPPATGGQA